MTFLSSLLARAVLPAVLLVLPASGVFAAGAVRCTVILDAESGDAIHREGTCDEAFYPMSTFKLPIALMGFDAGVLSDATAPNWPYQAKFDRPKRERKPVDPSIWMRDSIVWYSQEITRRLGQRRFTDYVNRLDYGNRDVSSGPGGSDGLTGSWLMASLKISADGQAAFLKRMVSGALPVSPEAVAKTMAVTPRFEAGDGWTVWGKTGSGRMRDARGRPDSNRPLGWFVGWAEREGERVVFARLFVDDKPHSQPISFTTRDGLIADLPDLLRAR